MIEARFAMIPLEVIADSRLTKNEIKLLLALFSFCGKDGKCHPSKPQLAARSGVQECRISGITNQLASYGWLTKSGNGGRNQRAQYRLKNQCQNGTDKEPENQYRNGTAKSTINQCQNGTDKGEINQCRNGSKTSAKTALRKEQTSKQTSKEKDKKEKWTLPDWLNRQAWEEFEQHRREIRKTLTDLARTKAANQLRGLTAEQQQQCVDMTIQNHWQGLFPQKVTNATRQQIYKSAGQNAADFHEDLKAYAAGNLGREPVRKNSGPLRLVVHAAVDDD